jgi:hypothetical protein
MRGLKASERVADWLPGAKSPNAYVHLIPRRTGDVQSPRGGSPLCDGHDCPLSGDTIASLTLVVGSASLTHFPQNPGTF